MIKAGIILAAMFVLLCILAAAGFYAFVFYYPERLHEDPYAPEMCDELYEACGSFKRRMSMPGAGHAVNAQKDLESYMQGVADFLKSCEIL